MPHISPLRKKIISALKPEEEEFLTRICHELEAGNLNDDLPVLYPGSGGDVAHAVLLGKNLVFVDSHQPQTTISEIRSDICRLGGDILEERLEGQLGKEGKYFVSFTLEDEKIDLTYYAQDATTLDVLQLEELRKGYSVYFLKVPLPKEISVGSLNSPISLGKALENLITGGFYVERECPIPRDLITEMGFKKIASGYISGLSIHSEEGNLYQKIEQVDNLEEILRTSYLR